MYILNIGDEERDTQWLCFDTEEEGRDFLNLLPGYHFSMEDGTQLIEDEWLDIAQFPEYEVITFKGNMIPISKFMFSNDQRVDLYFTELPNASIPHQGMIDGVTLIDAYAIPNAEIKDYVSARESVYSTIKSILEELGYEVERAFKGSEDGEAIIYKGKDDSDWHFLGHLDPSLVQLSTEGKEGIKDWVLNNLS